MNDETRKEVILNYLSRAFNCKLEIDNNIPDDNYLNSEIRFTKPDGTVVVVNYSTAAGLTLADLHCLLHRIVQ